MTYKDLKLDLMWQKIEEYNIATQEELELITNINGLNEKTLNDVVYARTGYRDLEQFENSEI